jgi:hypothetical protein
MSPSGMSTLEARYRGLLRAYPPWYRADRGEEMLATLLEAARPGQSRPTGREIRSLILGGLRTRARHGQQLTAAGSLRSAVLLAAVLILLTEDAFQSSMVWGGWAPNMPYYWIQFVLALLTLAVAVGAWLGQRAVAAAAIVCAGLWLYQPPDRDPSQAILLVLACIAVAVLALRRERLSRSWLWLAALAFALVELPRVSGTSDLLHLVGNYGLFVVLAATLAWSAVDARPMTAVALWLAAFYVGDTIEDFVRSGVHVYFWGWWLPALITTLLLGTAVWQTRRQALL